MKSFRQTCLEAQNEYRHLHGSQPLELSKKLNKYAQIWATYLAKKGEPSRRKTMNYGENVYIDHIKDFDKGISAQEVVDSWYNEHKLYKYVDAKPRNLKAVRNFTQMVWKASESVGIGMVVTPIGEVYVVCVYYPTGNVDEEFPENVLPPEGKEVEEYYYEQEEGCVDIKYIEPKEKVVNNMERLYGISSEQVRNWSIWLTHVGTEAETWRQWLRSYFHLIRRIAESLSKLEEENPDLPRMTPQERDNALRIFAFREDSDPNDGIPYPKGVDDFYDIEQVLANVVAMEEEDVEDENDENEAESEYERLSGGADVDQESMGESLHYTFSETEKKELKKPQEPTPCWPIGTPWEAPQIKEIIDTEDKYKILKMPNSAEELRRTIRDFTHQATIYRSCYEHWKRTADRAVKEMIGRQVYPTAVLEGILEGDDLFGSVLASLGYPKTSAKGITKKRPPMKVLNRVMEMSKKVGMEQFVNEMSDARENVPYFFYVKSKPDKAIAIEHQDKVVIPDHPAKEGIHVAHQHLYFNIQDEPGKGGKPWL